MRPPADVAVLSAFRPTALPFWDCSSARGRGQKTVRATGLCDDTTTKQGKNSLAGNGLTGIKLCSLGECLVRSAYEFSRSEETRRLRRLAAAGRAVPSL